MAKFSDVVILLPGITGSVLVDGEGKDVWSPSVGTIWRVVSNDGATMKSLELSSDDEDDRVTASHLVPDLTIIPGLVKIEGYSHIAQYLVSELGLVRGENFHEFPYDWRRDNRLTAQRLKTQAFAWLEQWRSRPGNEHARLVLIGHSMGGLVARYFVECLKGWQVTRTVMTLGTPHRGSLNALDSLENGVKKRLGPFGFDLTPVLRSLTSVYQLLPIYPCISVDRGPLLRVAEAAAKGLLSHVDPARAEDARSFHQEIEDMQAANAKVDAYAQNPPVVVSFVGIEQPTAQSAILLQSGLKMVNAYEGNDDRGDGTVPRVSATPIEADPKWNIYAGEMHGALQNADGALVNIKGILTSATIDLRRFMSAAMPAMLTLDLDDVMLAAGKFPVKARRSGGNAPVHAELTHLETGKIQTAVLQRADETGWKRGVFDLVPGIWRVTVRSDGAQPVSDIVVVAHP